jgi:hypothetical protein
MRLTKLGLHRDRPGQFCPDIQAKQTPEHRPRTTSVLLIVLSNQVVRSSGGNCFDLL